MLFISILFIVYILMCLPRRRTRVLKMLKAAVNSISSFQMFVYSSTLNVLFTNFVKCKKKREMNLKGTIMYSS